MNFENCSMLGSESIRILHWLCKWCELTWYHIRSVPWHWFEKWLAGAKAMMANSCGAQM